MHGDKKALSDMSNEILGRIIGFLGIIDGRGANKVNRDWHAIYTQPHEQKMRVEKYFPDRVLGINDTDFESIFRAESKKLLENLFGTIQEVCEVQDDEQLKTLDTKQIFPYVAAALTGEVYHVEGLGKAENDFLYVLAASRGYIDVDVTQLDESQKKWAICLAATFGCIRTVEAILNAEKVNVEDAERAFVKAAKHGHLEIVKLLLSRLGEVSFDSGLLALFNAAQEGHHNVVEYLYPLAASDMLADDKSKALNLVAQAGHRNIAEYLYSQVKDDISASDKGDALIFAAQDGHDAVVEYLYSQVKNDISDKDKGEALVLAARDGHYPVVTYLYPQVVDVISAEHKKEALEAVALNGHLAVVKYFYPLMVSEMSAEDKGELLLIGVRNGHHFVAEYLYPQVADFVPSEHKKWMLMFVAQERHLQVIKYLLEQHGNDFDIEYIQGALDYAKNENHTEIVDYLEETIIKRTFLELVGVFNGVELTPQFKHSRKDENNQAASMCEAVPAVQGKRGEFYVR